MASVVVGQVGSFGWQLWSLVDLGGCLCFLLEIVAAAERGVDRGGCLDFLFGIGAVAEPEDFFLVE